MTVDCWWNEIGSNEISSKHQPHRNQDKNFQGQERGEVLGSIKYTDIYDDVNIG